MKQYFVVNCITDWCGMDSQHLVLAESEQDVEQIAWDLAIENLFDFMSADELAEELGYNSEDYSTEEWEDVLDRINPEDYVRYTISPFEGTEKELEQLADMYGTTEI